jgi:hypothetical protein
LSKLYYLVPDAKTAESIVDDLRDRGVSDEEISVLGREDQIEQDLPDPDVSETSDVKPALKQGAALGGTTGLLAGLVATVVPGGLAIGGGALLGMTLAGSAFGAWASSLIGISVPNRELDEFQRAIDAGELLMIVSSAQIDRDGLKAVVSAHHPGVRYGGEEGAISGVS